MPRHCHFLFVDGIGKGSQGVMQVDRRAALTSQNVDEKSRLRRHTEGDRTSHDDLWKAGKGSRLMEQDVKSRGRR